MAARTHDDIAAATAARVHAAVHNAATDARGMVSNVRLQCGCIPPCRCGAANKALSSHGIQSVNSQDLQEVNRDFHEATTKVKATSKSVIRRVAGNVQAAPFRLWATVVFLVSLYIKAVLNVAAFISAALLLTKKYITIIIRFIINQIKAIYAQIWGLVNQKTQQTKETLNVTAARTKETLNATAARAKETLDKTAQRAQSRVQQGVQYTQAEAATLSQRAQAATNEGLRHADNTTARTQAAIGIK